MASGFTPVLPGSAYDAALGYGWRMTDSSAIGGRDRGAGSPDLRRDLNFGDAQYAHDEMQLSLEGTAAGGPVTQLPFAGSHSSDHLRIRTVAQQPDV